MCSNGGWMKHGRDTRQGEKTLSVEHIIINTLKGMPLNGYVEDICLTHPFSASKQLTRRLKSDAVCSFITRQLDFGHSNTPARKYQLEAQFGILLFLFETVKQWLQTVQKQNRVPRSFPACPSGSAHPQSKRSPFR